MSFNVNFPVQFMKPSDYNFAAPFVNFAGNAAIVGAGAVGVAAVSKYALPALGFNGTATAIVTGVSATVGVVGSGLAIVGVGAIAGLAIAGCMAMRSSR